MNHSDQANIEKKSPKEKPEGLPVTHSLPVEQGGPKGLEPTRYGDWERNGRCVDF